MDISTFREKFEELINQLEDVHEQLHHVVTETMSPSFSNQTLPTFNKRMGYQPWSREDRASQQQQMETYHQSSLRLHTIREALSNLHAKLNRTHDRMAALDPRVTPGADSPPRPAAPLLEGLQQLASRHDSNKIVSTRLQQAVSLFQSMIQNCRESWARETALQESVASVQQLLAETLLNNFQRDVNTMAAALKRYYDDKLSVHIRRFQEYCQHQRALALQQQHTFYKDMYQRVKRQHETYAQMMNILQYQTQMLPQKERQRCEQKMRDLQKRNRSLFVEAEIYYQQGHQVVVLQPMSPLFYKAIRQWLLEYQRLLLEILSRLNVHWSASPLVPSEDDKKDDKKAGGAASAALEHSILYKYAQRLEPSKLTDQSSALLMHPSSTVISDLLVGFTNFHFSTNRQNMEQLQQKMQRLEHSWKALSENVKRAHELQQKWYSLKDAQLPDIRQASAAAASSLGTGIAGAGAGTSSSPEVIKLLLKLDRELKLMEDKLRQTFHTLFSNVKPEFLRTQEQNRELVQIIEFLKQFQQLSHEWETRIKHEQGFVQAWKDMCQGQSRYIALQFIEWNHFVSQQLDMLKSALDVFATNVFYRLRELGSDFVTHLLRIQQKRQHDLDLETNLLNSLQDDLRREDAHLADELVRLQSHVFEWMDHTRRVNLIEQQTRFHRVLQYHVAALDALIEHLNTDHPSNYVLPFLVTLDRMYELCLHSDDTVTKEQEQELGKQQYMIQKLDLLKEPQWL